jgi:two-component system, NtrC family, sensor histidine kinase HydH
MHSHLMVRMTGPIVASSLLLLAIGLGTAWYVQHWQAMVSQELRVNVSGIRAAEELEILVREARTRLDHFLITGDREYLAKVVPLRAPIEHWLGEAEHWGITPNERRLTTRARKGNEQFWAELERIGFQVPDDRLPGQIRTLIDDVLVREILEPAHEYLDVNEDEVKDSIEKNQAFADRLVYALLLLGTCGSAAGLLAGIGFARRLRRSLVQLSVLIRDTAGRLDDGVKPITFSGTDLGELETVLRLIGDRVATMVKHLQQREREAIRAEQLAAMGQLAAGMAHELRNPLMSMKVLVQGALAGPSAEDDDHGHGAVGELSIRDLAVLDEEIARLEQLLQSFLDLARPPEPSREMTDVCPLVEQSLAFLTGRAAALSTSFECAVPPAPVYAAVDAGQFRQVLVNLVLNALESMPGGGVIRVCVQPEADGWLTVEVADRGCGLPSILGGGIFDPFITTKETGLGLGLSICTRIALAHGGTLSAKDRPGGGAVFTFRLAQAIPSPVLGAAPGRSR